MIDRIDAALNQVRGEEDRQPIDLEPQRGGPELPNPYFLMVVRENSEHLKIDRDEPGWATTYADWMRGRLRWYLCRKADDVVVFGVDVRDGDQPFYYKRHTTDLNGPLAGVEWVAYGIGAKRADGTRDGVWITQEGLVCDDHDVDTLMRG
jgi:hypothetical protein